MENRKFETLRKLAQESRKHPELLLRTSQGYKIYASYELIPHLGQILVIEPSQRVQKFSTMKSALRYCTAMKHQDFPAARHICTLDQQLGRAQADIDIHMTRIQNMMHVGLHESKLGQAQALRENAKIHLDKYPIVTKYLQTKRITPDETHRPCT
jgi:hypothetical protein